MFVAKEPKYAYVGFDGTHHILQDQYGGYQYVREGKLVSSDGESVYIMTPDGSKEPTYATLRRWQRTC